VLSDLDLDPTRNSGDRSLQPEILERLHTTAATTDRVMVVMTVGTDPLVAGGPARGFEALDQSQLLELLERPVDAGPADGGLSTTQLCVQIERGDGTIVPGQGLDHSGAGTTAAIAGGLEGRERVLCPSSVGGRCRHLRRS